MKTDSERIEQPGSDEELRRLLLRLQRLEAEEMPLDGKPSGKQATAVDAPRVTPPGTSSNTDPATLAQAVLCGFSKYRTELVCSFVGGFISIVALTFLGMVTNKPASEQAATLHNAATSTGVVIANHAALPPIPPEMTSPNFIPASYTASEARLQTAPLSDFLKRDSLFYPPRNHNSPSPHILAVAARIEARVDREVRFFMLVSNAGQLPLGTTIVILGLPEYIALTSAQSLGFGTWVVDPAAAADVRMTMYAAPARDLDVRVELVAADGKLIANSRTTLVAAGSMTAQAPVRAAAAAVDAATKAAKVRAIVRKSQTLQRGPRSRNVAAVPAKRPAIQIQRQAARPQPPLQPQTQAARPLVWPGDSPQGKVAALKRPQPTSWVFSSFSQPRAPAR